jgi:hypothetical protein
MKTQCFACLLFFSSDQMADTSGMSRPFCMTCAERAGGTKRDLLYLTLYPGKYATSETLAEIEMEKRKEEQESLQRARPFFVIFGIWGVICALTIFGIIPSIINLNLAFFNSYLSSLATCLLVFLPLGYISVGLIPRLINHLSSKRVI